MNTFKLQALDLKDSLFIQGFFMHDSRGSFYKCFEKTQYQIAGIPFCIQESFITTSAKNVIRGMHFQTHEPQAKLVSVLQGSIYDVIVDLRPESETFGEWRGYEMHGSDALSLYIPRGFAHGFAALEDNSMMLYQCEGAYDKASDTGIRYNDPDLHIQWPFPLQEAIVSDKDASLPWYSELYGDLHK